jgi:hypothetical protein
MNPIQVANELHGRGFEYWLLVFGIAVAVCVLWGFKYLLKRDEANQEVHKSTIRAMMDELTSSRQHHHDKMEAMQSRAFDMVREVAALNANTNKIIESNTRESEKVRILIEKKLS